MSIALPVWASPVPGPVPRTVTRRHVFPCLLLIVSVFSCFILINWTTYLTPHVFIWGLRAASTNSFSSLRPPTWALLRRDEINLPQHNLNLPQPEGQAGRYVKFSNTWQSIGWNNVNHDMLLNAYLAYESGRTYVFEDFVWNPTHYPWQIFPQFRLFYPHTPLSALLDGPISGGSWPADEATPRSISTAWFDVVCPPSSRHQISVADVKPSVQHLSGSEQLDHWKNLLSSSPHQCIEIMPVEETAEIRAQTFDMGLLGSPRALSLWEGFVQSPVSQGLKSSAVVERAVRRNENLFRGDGTEERNPFESMMAVHVRKGDFLSHCKRLAEGKDNFFGWNQHPELPDPLTSDDNSSLDRFLRRCLPTSSEMMTKILHSRLDYLSKASSSESIDTLYLMTNEPGAWIDELKTQLAEEGFKAIVSNWDLRLDAEETEVSIEVDVDIAASAKVFVGNGWSSVGSTMVYRRHLRGHPMSTMRFF